MSEDERKALESLLMHGTPLPWVYMGSTPDDNPYWGQIRCAYEDDAGAPFTHVADTPPDDERDADMTLIVGCVNALPALLADSRRADEAEDWCARLANDGSQYDAGVAAGVAKALAALAAGLADYERMGTNTMYGVGCIDGRRSCVAIVERLGGAGTPPHERTRRRLARLEAACRALLACWPDSGDNLNAWVNQRRAAVQQIHDAMEGDA